MRLKTFLAATVALVGLAITLPQSASADGIRAKPDGRSKARHVTPRVHSARSAYDFDVDPYAWRYSPRGYYPYYGSDYWAKARYIKARNRAHLNVWNTQPPYFHYYKAWSYPKKDWSQAAWHYDNHGFHHRWHW